MTDKGVNTTMILFDAMYELDQTTSEKRKAAFYLECLLAATRSLKNGNLREHICFELDELMRHGLDEHKRMQVYFKYLFLLVGVVDAANAAIDFVNVFYHVRTHHCHDFGPTYATFADKEAAICSMFVGLIEAAGYMIDHGSSGEEVELVKKKVSDVILKLMLNNSTYKKGTTFETVADRLAIAVKNHYRRNVFADSLKELVDDLVLRIKAEPELRKHWQQDQTEDGCVVLANVILKNLLQVWFEGQSALAVLDMIAKK